MHEVKEDVKHGWVADSTAKKKMNVKLNSSNFRTHVRGILHFPFSFGWKVHSEALPFCFKRKGPTSEKC